MHTVDQPSQDKVITGFLTRKPYHLMRVTKDKLEVNGQRRCIRNKCNGDGSAQRHIYNQTSKIFFFVKKKKFDATDTELQQCVPVSRQE